MRTLLLVAVLAQAFDFSHPKNEPCEVTWQECAGHTSCTTKAEARRRQRAWRVEAATVLRAHGWTVVEPKQEAAE